MNEKRNIKNIIVKFIPAFLWMCVIFYMSNKNGEGSGSMSLNISEKVVGFVDMFKKYDASTRIEVINNVHPLIRKLAHVTEYTILYLLFVPAFRYAFVKLHKFQVLFISAGATILYAISDEVHQLFIPGRCGTYKDVLIDSIGVILVFVIQSLLHLNHKEKKNTYEKLSTKPVTALIITLSIPTTISMLITNIYNLADTAFVGTLGNSASGAVGVVFGFMAVLQAIGFLFGQGGGSILSRYMGAKEQKRANATASVSFFSAFIVASIVAVICVPFLRPIVMFFGSTNTIAPYAEKYIFCILMAAPFLVTSFTLNNILRYEGKAFLGMIGMMSGALLNIFGDYVLMVCFKFGIEGAGIATAVSQVVSFAILISMFASGNTVCKISFKLFLDCVTGAIKDREVMFVKAFANITSTGLPSLLRQGLSSVATIVLNNQAAHYGDEGVAAMSIVARISFFVFSVSLGIGQGFQPVGGFSYGAKLYERLKKAFFVTVILSSAVLLVLSTICFIISGGLIEKFRDDPTVIEMGTRGLRIACIGQQFIPFAMSTEMLLQCTGKRFNASLLSMIRNGIIFIPVLLILARCRGMYGIEEAQPVSFVIAFIPALYFAIKYFKDLDKEVASSKIEDGKNS